MVPLLERRQATYPSRAGCAVAFAWPRGIPVSDPEAAIEDVKAYYTAAAGWRVLRWEATKTDGVPAIVAHQRRSRTHKPADPAIGVKVTYVRRGELE